MGSCELHVLGFGGQVWWVLEGPTYQVCRDVQGVAVVIEGVVRLKVLSDPGDLQPVIVVQGPCGCVASLLAVVRHL